METLTKLDLDQLNFREYGILVLIRIAVLLILLLAIPGLLFRANDIFSAKEITVIERRSASDAYSLSASTPEIDLAGPQSGTQFRIYFLVDRGSGHWWRAPEVLSI